MAFIEPVRTADTSDAEIIRLCKQHIVNLHAYNASTEDIEPEDDPLWAAYKQSYNAVKAARPQTIEGMIAVALAAKAEAVQRDGTESLEHGPAAEWAWGLVNDLVRLKGEPDPDAELIAACNEYLRIERGFEAIYVTIDGNMPDNHPALDLLDPIPELVEKIVSLRATTTEGIAVLARCMALKFRANHADCQDDPDGAEEDRLQAALMRSLVALEMGVANAAP